MMLMRLTNAVAARVVAGILATVMMSGSVSAAEDEAAVYAFPDKYMLRVGAYIIDGSNTQFTISSDTLGAGTLIDYQRDLGGEARDTIPRIDAYYRFNERHRIEFTTFSVDRSGTQTLAIEVQIDDEIFSAGETLDSEIKYTLYKVGYGYSFYHSPKVELSITAGLNITEYDLRFASGSDKFESAGFTVPLPMFGLYMGYAFTPKWSVSYLAETFFIDYEDTLTGNLFSYELSTEYKLFKHFAIGAGTARLGTDVEVNDDDWIGKVTDSYRGYRVFGTLYF
jgi:hypothetical protein